MFMTPIEGRTMTLRTLSSLQAAYTKWRVLYESESTGQLAKLYYRYKMWRIRLKISSLRMQTTEDDGY